MKRCSQCNSIYQDDLNYCPSDGGQLIPILDSFSEETVIRPSPFAQPTSLIIRKGVNPIFAYLTVGFLALFIGGALVFWLKSGPNTSFSTKDEVGQNTEIRPNTNSEIHLNANSDVLQPTVTPTPIANVDGIWIVRYSFSDDKPGAQPGRFDLRLTYRGNKLIFQTYDYVGSASGTWYVERGTLKGNRISFDMDVRQDIQTTYSGLVNNDKMTGSIVHYNISTRKRSSVGTWTATRK